MFTLLKTIFGTGLSSVLSPLKIALFVALFAALAGAGYLIYDAYQDYGKMKGQIATLNIEKQNLTQQLKEKADEINKLKESNSVTVAVVSDNLQEHNKAETTLNKTTNKRDKKVEQIKDDFSKLPPTEENKTEEVKQISTANIDALWDTFCEATALSEGVADCQTLIQGKTIPIDDKVDKTDNSDKPLTPALTN